MLAVTSRPFILVCLPLAGSGDPRAVKGLGAGRGQSVALGVWPTCSGKHREQGFLTAGLRAAQRYLVILQGSGSGLRGHWPQIQHFRGQGQGQGHREEARRREGFPHERAKGQNKTPATEGDKSSYLETPPRPPSLGQVPT